MNLDQIERELQSEDPSDRMRGITALREYEPEIAVPLLLTRAQDSEVMIRSFVVMGLGYKQNATAHDALLAILQNERDPNVRAEAANSLGKYGESSIPTLVKAFRENEHWLMRLSVLPILVEMNRHQEVFELCQCGLSGQDITVKTVALDSLASLVGTLFEAEALAILLAQVSATHWSIRRQVALSLKAFQDERAIAALSKLRRDPDYRVVAALLEGLLPTPSEPV
jgi:HEAT repeat protein